MLNQRLIRVPILDRDSRVIGRAIEIVGPPGRHAQRSEAYAEDELFDALVDSDLDLVGGGEPVLLPWSANLSLAPVQSAIATAAHGSGVDVVVPATLFSDLATGELLHLLRSTGVGLWAGQVSREHEARSLARVADGFVIDLDHADPAFVELLVGVGHETGRPVIARHIDDPDQWDHLRELGVAAVSASPALLGLLSGPVTVDADQVQAFQVISLLADEATGIDELNEAVRTNVELSLRVLRLVNSASAGPRREISSVREAIVMVGRKRLREWVYLTTTQRLGHIAQESASVALVRARFCEVLAPQVVPDHVGESFLAGLLSGVVDHLAADHTALTKHLPLTPTTRALLDDSSGPLAVLVDLARSCESNALTVTHPAVTGYEVTCAYLDAMAWTSRSIRGAAPAGESVEPGSRVGALMRRMQASVATAGAAAAGRAEGPP